MSYIYDSVFHNNLQWKLVMVKRIHFPALIEFLYDHSSYAIDNSRREQSRVGVWCSHSTFSRLENNAHGIDYEHIPITQFK